MTTDRISSALTSVRARMDQAYAKKAAAEREIQQLTEIMINVLKREAAADGDHLEETP